MNDLGSRFPGRSGIIFQTLNLRNQGPRCRRFVSF